MLWLLVFRACETVMVSWWQVARFFRTFHADNFMLYNCTSECTYPTGPFGGNVRRAAA